MIPAQTLKEILLKSKFVKPEDLDQAEKTALQLNRPLQDILIFKGLISEESLGQLIAEYFHAPFINLKNKIIPLEILEIIPEKAAQKYKILPFAIEKNIVSLAMEDPQDIEATEFVKRKSSLKVKPFYTTPASLRRATGQYKKSIKKDFDKIIAENLSKSRQLERVDDKEIEKVATDLPVIRILDTILEYAFAEGASDIHFEILSEEVLVRFRIDGILHDIISLPAKVQPAIVARVKILSKLKIDEHRLPQDGRFKFQIGDEYISLRVSIMPTLFGENIVLRLLPESARPLSLEELGLTGKNLEIVRNNIQKPHGMILVTGPTGCGKTTTLYSILNILNDAGVKICTIEDPIEYAIRRINQTQINPQAGLSFATGLRSLLRHDPDIMMVGEIRDNETAEMAIHSALTGHLVLSTLHTNDAPGAIPRFLDMGAEAFLLASTVNVVIAQRLVRRICTNCVQQTTPDAKILNILLKTYGTRISKQKFYQGKGCPECNLTGYKGRVGIFEVLEVDADIQDLTLKKAPSEEIEKVAKQKGMISMSDDGLDKTAAGLTTIEEVLRAVRE